MSSLIDRLAQLIVGDNVTPGTDAQECMISTAPQRDWKNPTTWGTLLLKPAP